MMSMSPTQGISQQHPFALSPTSPTSTRGFKRSASTDDENEHGDGDTRPSSARRNTAVKRACNECRQQKVSARACWSDGRGWVCDVQADAPIAASTTASSGRISEEALLAAPNISSLLHPLTAPF